MSSAEEFFAKAVSLHQLALLYDIPRRTLSEWASKDPNHPDPVVVRPGGKQYFLLKAHIQYTINRYKNRASDPSLGKLPAEVALLEAKAKREAIRADKEEGQAVLIEDIGAILARREAAARKAFDGLAQRLAPRLAELSDAHDIAELLAKEINGAIAQLPKEIRS